MARFYANENFPLAVVRHLRQLGHDVLTVAEAGNAGLRIPDDQVLTFAIRQQRAVLTINRRDFIRLHRVDSNHAGIIACTQDEDANGQAIRIDQASQQVDSLQAQLIRVYKPQ